MPPVDEATPTDDQQKSQAPATKSFIGIIYPPPEIRNIVDKTASFVARIGPEFETRVRQNELNNAKFNFLNPADPYHSYYEHKVTEFREGKAVEPSSDRPSGIGIQLQTKALSMEQQEQQQQQQQTQPTEPLQPLEQPSEFEFVADPPSIAAYDLDIVKLAAQFVARNGRVFLTSLINREMRNYQFDFLRPQHSLFAYFTKLVDQYTKVMNPPDAAGLLAKLKLEAEDTEAVLKEARKRVDWQKFQEAEKQREEEATERERVAYAQIDWHDFVVVETVDFQPNEHGNFPPPTNPDEVGARMLMQEHKEKGELGMSDEEGSDEDMEESESDEEDVPAPPPPATRPPPQQIREMAPPPPPQPVNPPVPPQPEQVIIRRDYNPKMSKPPVPLGPKTDILISPLTGEKIAASKVSEHMKYNLLDPKWIEQKDRSVKERMEQEEVFAGGTSIEKSLKKLAERRTDIFGAGTTETQIGKKIGEVERQEAARVMWDGHSGSIQSVAAKARANVTITDQIKMIHQVKGLIPGQETGIGPEVTVTSASRVPSIQEQPPVLVTAEETTHPPPAPPPKPAIPPQPPAAMLVPPQQIVVQQPPPIPVIAAQPVAPAPVMVVPRPPVIGSVMVPVQAAPTTKSFASESADDAPPTKRSRTEEMLIPEEDFARKNLGPVTFSVQVPNAPEKSEWKLNGQQLNLTLLLTDSVSVIKAKLHDALGMPAGKQKLSLDGMFIKDSNTLAYYNVARGNVVQLSIKERGGRKK